MLGPSILLAPMKFPSACLDTMQEPSQINYHILRIFTLFPNIPQEVSLSCQVCVRGNAGL